MRIDGRRMAGTVGAVLAVGLMPTLVGAERPPAAVPAVSPAAVTAQPTAFVPVAPFRILDTRQGIGTGGATAPVGPGQTIDLQVGGVGTIPAEAVGVVLNVTGTQATEPTWVAAWPAGTEREETSVLNLTPGIDAPNMVTALLGQGRLSLYNNAGSAHLVADAAGYLVPASATAGTAVPGPMGPAGPAGPAGPQGVPGPPGLADIQVVEVFGSAPAGAGAGATANCPAGKVAIAGGASSRHSSLRMYGSWPAGDTGWFGVFARDVGSASANTDAPFAVYAVCARVG